MRYLRPFISALVLQRDRWILWTPVPLALGIAIYFSLPSEPPGFISVLLPLVLVAAMAPFYRNKAALYLWLPFFLAALGFSSAQFRTWSVDAAVLHKKTHAPLTVRGRIIDVDAVGRTHRVTLDGLSFTGGALPQNRMPERVRIKLKNNDPAAPEEGDVVEVRAMLLPLSMPVLPGAYDFQRHGYFHGLGSTGYALSEMTVVEKHKTEHLFDSLRRGIHDRVYAAGLMPENIEGLTVAFMTGDSGGIAKHDWDVARQSGIAHLIAISGSHFAMIVGVVFFAVRALLAAIPYVALRWPVKKIAAVAGMFAAVFYVLLIGAPISAQRAAVMSCAVMLAILLDRDPFTLRLAALAAFAVLLAEPESLAGPSFQMSFAAVIGLIAFFESSRDLWSRMYHESGFFRRCGLFLLTCFLTSLVASLAVGPYTLYHFLRDPLFTGLVANMVAVPLSSFVTFPVSLLACLLMPLGLEKWPLYVTEKSISVIMRAAETVTQWPHMTLTADAWPAWALAVITLGGLWLCLWHGRIRWLGLAPVFLAALLVAQRPRPDVIVGGNFKLLAAVKDPAGRLWLSPGRADKFIRDEWIAREGGRGSYAWPEQGTTGGFLSCSAHACAYGMKGRTVLFVKDGAAAAAEECRRADIIVTPQAVKPDFPCAAAVIDKWSLYDYGTHVIYLSPGQPPLIKTVAEARGERPWTGRRPWKKKPA